MSPTNGAGQYRTPITIRKAVESTDELGTVTQTWDTDASIVCTDRAAFYDQTGHEFYAAQSTHSEMTAMLRIRYRSGITEEMQVWIGDSKLEIIAPPIDVEMRHRELILHCAEVK